MLFQSMDDKPVEASEEQWSVLRSVYKNVDDVVGVKHALHRRALRKDRVRFVALP